MLDLMLTPHPSTPGGPVRSVAVAIRLLTPQTLAIRYRAKGTIDELKVPPEKPKARADDLWRHTCFEAFVGAADSDPYFEFNFSPSRLWAAYRFSSYRADMSVATQCAPPEIEVLQSAESLTLKTVLDLGCLDAAALHGRLRVALSAVIEDKTGAITYWALAHPSAKPDFHHPDSFAFNLKKAARS